LGNVARGDGSVAARTIREKTRTSSAGFTGTEAYDFQAASSSQSNRRPHTPKQDSPRKTTGFPRSVNSRSFFQGPLDESALPACRNFPHRLTAEIVETDCGLTAFGRFGMAAERNVRKPLYPAIPVFREGDAERND
jgi:hypothetical protein